ncbi:DEAD/DEAH box helicase [Candidatus Micrarchaeota archaeon]|nr:DEAD/DEAH box helicase [Candidatus Micrarchaeota archaeon]
MALTQSETLSKLGYSDLNPLQQKALKEGFLDSPRTLVSAPTASGKTLLALLSITRHFESSDKTAFYVVPLRALASEKYREFKEQLAAFELSVGVSTGDFDSSSLQLEQYDVVIVTSEKLDSLLRHDASWLEKMGLIVFDEAHLLGDGHRGATLEVVLTKAKNAGVKVLALSATIPNDKAFAQWLDAKLVQSNYRPTPLVMGVCDSKALYMEDETTVPVESPAIKDLAQKALSEKNGKGQGLFFVSTRRFAESAAKQLLSTVKPFLSEEEKAQCGELARKALKTYSVPTSQCKLLSECLQNGVAFHHAGLGHRERELIEDGFKKHRCIKVISATTTLAAGLDLPASWVVVRDLKRYNGEFSDFIPKIEVAQMLGRSGRPKYDSRGVGVMMCQPYELRAVRNKYIFGELEDVYSQLSAEPSLRAHALGLLASNYAGSYEELFGFFSSTFYAHQYGDTQQLLSGVERVVNQLKDMDFAREKKSKLLATPAGKRVSELYIDPLTAHAFLKSMAKKQDDFQFILTLQKATESRPLIRVKRNEETKLWDDWFALDADDEQDEEALPRLKSAKLVNAWVNEHTEDAILRDFDVPPGVLHSRIRIQEWLAYAYSELAYLLNQSTALGTGKTMRRRIKHGVKAELLPLVSLKGVGRVRARRLWNKGIRSPDAAEALTDEEKKTLWKQD